MIDHQLQEQENMDPYTMFVYGIRSPYTKESYFRRLRSFFEAINLDKGKTFEEPATISLGKQERILTGLLVIINDMFLYLGAYKGQNWGKLAEPSKPESGRKLTETAINHTHLLRIKKKRRSEEKFYRVIYFEGVRNDVVANEYSKFIETHTHKIKIVNSIYMILGSMH